MMPTHSGGFDGTDVFNHPQNHPNGHPRRHAHRIGASVALFYTRHQSPFWRVFRVDVANYMTHNQSKIGIFVSPDISKYFFLSKLTTGDLSAIP